MHIRKDLYTIYGELLVKKDVEITPRVVSAIRRAGLKHRDIRVSMKNTDIFADFKKIFSDKRYTGMFKPPVTKNQICNIAGKLMIESDLVFELSVMKNNQPYTYYHVLVVAAFVIKLSQIHGPSMFNKEIVCHCGFTHDIGKTRIPNEILDKKTRLSADEMAMLKTHPTIGYTLLNYYLKSDRRDCSLASLEHHEKLDGSGYPNGIRKLNKYTELISPVDIMDALLTQRPYRKQAYSLRTALDYLVGQAHAGRLSMDVVLSLISCARKDKPDVSKIKISRQPRDPLPEELTNEKFK